MFTKGSKVHLIGIKGVGMTALADIFKSRGVKVSGSDGPAQFFTDEVLADLKIPFYESFNADHIPNDVDVVVSSVAYYFGGKSLQGNPEVDAALRRKLPMYTYPEALGLLSDEYQVVAVAGSHGKSTTTALLGWILAENKVDPNVIVGTKVNTWEKNSRSGASDWLIVEADEYREAFLHYKPFGAIITSIDYDHPDYFKTRAEYYRAFKRFVDSVNPNGWLVLNGDDLELRSLALYAAAKGLRVVTYGFLPGSDVQLSDAGVVKQEQLFHIMFGGKQDSKQLLPGATRKKSIFKKADQLMASMSFPGKQYVLNSGAAFAAALHFGIAPEKIVKAIKTFPGTARRLQILKQTKQAIIIDDYAHHPTAIAVTLAGIREMYPEKRITVIFQPHMFSRTEALLKQFATCFSTAHNVGIMEIYPSARETAGPVRGRELAAQTKFHHKNVTYLKDTEAAKEYLAQHATGGNVVVLMGAGNVNDLVSS